MKYRLHLAYKGSSYKGWQKQPEGNTVQDHLEKALHKIFNEPVRTVGSGRTDAGVHARNQVVHFGGPAWERDQDLCWSLSSQLPQDIVVTKAYEAPESFHALHSAEAKIYRYQFFESARRDPFRNDSHVWLRKALNWDNIQKGAQVLVGEHDFASFQSVGTPVKSTVRIIKQIKFNVTENEVIVDLEGNGFLKQMVRNILGTLMGLEADSNIDSKILEILNKKDRQAAGKTAPPEGLYLYDVKYPFSLDNECRQL